MCRSQFFWNQNRTDKVLDWWWEFTRAIDQGNFAIAHHVQAAEIVELHKRFF